MGRTDTSDGRRLGRLRRAASSVVVTHRGIGFLIAALVCFVAAAALSLPALLYATGLLLALVLLSSVFVVVGHSRVRIERSFAPAIVRPGALSRATVSVTNVSVLPCLEADWADHLPPGITGEANGTLPALGGSRSADSRVSFSYPLHGLRRGVHDIGPLRVNVQDPFGLVYRRHSFGDVEPLTILPRLVDLPAIAPRGTSEDGAARPAPQHVGIGDDDIIARSYLPGDALKRIHWKATAHRGELMVRQEEQQVTPRAGVFLDCEPDSQGTERDRQGSWVHSAGFEWSVTAAASITVHLVRAGYVVALQSSGASVDRLVADSHDTLEDAMVDLAVIQPEPQDHHATITPENASFVVLGRLSGDRARHWVATLSTPRMIVALVAHGSSAEALDVLDGARWRVVEYGAKDDLAEIWSQIDGTTAHASR